MDEFYKDTVTLYNHYENEATYEEFWYPTVLAGVRLRVHMGADISQNGTNGNNNATLNIKTDELPKGYLLPKEWKRAEDKNSVFTLSEKDFFVEGDTSAEDHSQENFFQYMKSKYDRCFQITSVDEYTVIPHLEVGGK